MYFRNQILSVLGLFSKPEKGIHIINAHYLDSHNQNDSGARFIKQLKNIEKHATLVRIEEAVSMIQDRKDVDRPYVAFTFDDGFSECYNTIAPILEKFNINAAFFINPNFVECDDNYYKDFSSRVTVNGKKPMSWKEISDLSKRGHLIGAHTMDHVNLGNDLTQNELEYQLKICRSTIEDNVGNICDMFAFPYGQIKHLSEKALKVAQDHYKYIFSGTDYKNYLSFGNKVINRRHIEPFWPVSHANYFLSAKKKFN